MKKIFPIIFICLINNWLYSQIPVSFDLRNVNGNNYVTSVKNQQGGNSWTFAVCASAESNLLINGNWTAAGETGEPDLAEYHIDWWNGFNKNNNDDAGGTNTSGFDVHSGGTFSMATAYLSRGEGFVRNIDGQSYDTPSDRYNPNYRYWYIPEIENYTIDNTLTGIDTLKAKIMQKGAAAAAICYDASFIDTNFNHFQPASSNLAANHAVAIIGWDDNHSVPAAPENGAWLAKNCWGTSWGKGGYFWISYYDKYACKTYDTGAHFYAGADTLPYDIIYYHDYHGRQDVMTSADSIFNVFHAKENVRLKSVSFFTETENENYTIKVFGGFDGTNLTHIKTATSGIILHKGFHTVNIPGDVPVNNGEKFYVMLSLSDSKFAYDRTSNISITYGGKSSKNLIESSAASGESYYSAAGQWIDFYDYNDPSGFKGTGNFCLKVSANYNENLGVNEKKQEIIIFPNPVKNILYINSSEKVFCKIVDISGKYILGKQITGNDRINVSGLKSGIYFVEILSPTGYDIKKIIIP